MRLVGAPGTQPNRRGVRTVTRDLEGLRDWLWTTGGALGWKHGRLRRPVYAILEEHFELIVGNARHRNVPGRKTDEKDSEWIADLVRHGLIAKS